MKSLKIRRIALGTCVSGFALVVYVLAGPAQSLTAGRDETCETCPRKRGMAVTGDPVIDAARFTAMVAATERDIQAILDDVRDQKLQSMSVWRGHYIRSDVGVAANDLALHKAMGASFGDPPAPAQRLQEFAWIGKQGFTIVGWNGVIVEHLATKAGYEFVLRIGPALMSDRHTVVNTRHEYLETWLLGRDGTLKFIRGEPTEPSLAGSILID
jgi:hypothetical protein